MDSKKWWQSKTAWVNFLVIGIAGFFPESYRGVVSEQNVIMAISVINLILRTMTKDGINREII